MNIKKIILTFFLSAMLCSFAVPANAQQPQSEDEFIRSLGIAADFSSENITRAETASIAASILNISGEGTADFADVSSSHKNYRDISAVVSAGIMSGSGGYFNPDNIISKAEFITVLLRTAGYRDIAEQFGGYPYGYLKLASETRLSGGLDDYYSPVSSSDAMKLLYKLLNIDYAGVDDVYTINGNAVSSLYTLGSGKTVLKQFFGIDKVKGVVCATENIYIGNRKLTNKNNAIVCSDGVDFICQKDGNIDKYVGFTSNVYLKDDKIVFIDTLKEAETITVSDRDFVSISSDLRTLKYLEDGKSKTASIRRNADFVYNGRSCYGVLKSDFNVENGLLELYDFDLDGVYEYVKIESCTPVVVNSINYDTKTFNDIKTNKTYNYDDSKNLVVVSDGREYDFSNIKKYDLLFISESKGTDSLTTINVSGVAGEGTVDAVSSYEIVIDGDSYGVGKNINTAAFKTGKNYLVAVDKSGAVVYFMEKSGGNSVYAYVIDAGQKSGIKKQVQIKMFTADNEVVVFDVADKVKINGTRTDNTDIFSTSLFSGGSVLPQLVSYKLNSSGKINSIGIASAEQEPSMERSENLTLNADMSALLRLNGNGSVGTADGSKKYLMSPATCVFVVEKQGSSINENTLWSCKKADLKFVGNLNYNVKVYDSSYAKVCGAIVFEINPTLNRDIRYPNTECFIVSDVAQTLNDDGEEVVMLKGMAMGKEVSYTENEYVKFDGISCGDVIYMYIEGGRPVSAEKAFGLKSSSADASYTLTADLDWSTAKGMLDFYSSNAYMGRLATIYGKIDYVSRDDVDSVVVVPNGTTIRHPVFLANTTRIYIYDAGRKNLRVGTQFDLDLSKDSVFLCVAYSTASDIIIYEQ